MELDQVKTLIALCTVGFTYWKFFYEGAHKQRIEFDIDLVDMGETNESRIVEIGVVAENKGFVEQRFDKIFVKVRGIEQGTKSSLIKGYEPRVAFDKFHSKTNLVTKKIKYFFVRPSVKQRFPLVLSVPTDWTHIHVRTTFKYQNTNNLHTTERAFFLSTKADKHPLP